MKISVVVPTKNEEKTIASVVSSVKMYANEVIVVDGHSTDDTANIARSKGSRVIYDNGRGKGDAIRTGIKHAKYEVIVFFDADGSHKASDIPKLIKPIKMGEADMVIGSRMLGGSDELHGTLSNFMRMFGGSILSLLINYRWGSNLTDCENGFRAIKINVAKNLELEADDFDIEEEMVVKCLKKKYRIKEVPSHEYERKAGHSKINLWKMGYKFILRILVNMV